MFKKLLYSVACVLSVVMLQPTGLHASLIGDDVFVSIGDSLGNFDSNTVTVIDTGVPEWQVAVGGSLFVFDISAELIEVRYVIDIPKLQTRTYTLVFDDLDWRDEFGAIIPGELVDVAATQLPTGGGVFKSLDAQILSSGFQVTFVVGSGSYTGDIDIDLTVEHTVIPEPGTYLLLGSTLGLVGLARKRRQIKAA